jgi:hypothetical protein
MAMTVCRRVKLFKSGRVSLSNNPPEGALGALSGLVRIIADNLS